MYKIICKLRKTNYEEDTVELEYESNTFPWVDVPEHYVSITTGSAEDNTLEVKCYETNNLYEIDIWAGDWVNQNGQLMIIRLNPEIITKEEIAKIEEEIEKEEI